MAIRDEIVKSRAEVELYARAGEGGKAFQEAIESREIARELLSARAALAEKDATIARLKSELDIMKGRSQGASALEATYDYIRQKQNVM